MNELKKLKNLESETRNFQITKGLSSEFFVKDFLNKTSIKK